MDRFIEPIPCDLFYQIVDLKSNMDRFIANKIISTCILNII